MTDVPVWTHFEYEKRSCSSSVSPSTVSKPPSWKSFAMLIKYFSWREKNTYINVSFFCSWHKVHVKDKLNDHTSRHGKLFCWQPFDDNNNNHDCNGRCECGERRTVVLNSRLRTCRMTINFILSISWTQHDNDQSLNDIGSALSSVIIFFIIWNYGLGH